ncbi:peptidoglycan DD-metalloendopeptidase family protein [uncultured Tateyamaria sp.]|uniref:M23 family metallopeptidase n=1 Tax=uncultured Tateyamaria sp. TaxID=455651 RepID=UPI0026294A27|nr:peptidoglycan DD-metalloendopeptidase family protein [uncultured Tateyamaria sp.]
MPVRSRFRLWHFAIFSFIAIVSLVAPSLAQNISGGFSFEAYRIAVMGPESGRRYNVLNRVTGRAAGAYQFMPRTLADLGYVSSVTGGWGWDDVVFNARSRALGVSSLNDFLNTEAGERFQDRAFDEFTARNWVALSASTKSYIGKTPAQGVLITEGGLLSAAHFLGAGGMNNFVRSGFTGANLNNLALILRQNFPSDPTLERLDRYVMGRLVSGAAAHGGIAGASGYGGSPSGGTYTADQVAQSAAHSAVSGVCMTHPVMSTSGQRVTSPYGVDRTGRASAGWHQGLDLANNVGRGDPIYAGVNGRVVVAGSGSGGNRVVIETSDGTQRFVFMHLDSIHRDVRRIGTTVAPDTQIGTMGDTGSPGSIHLHLGTLIQGSQLQGVGMESRIWESPGGWTGSKRSNPLTADQIASALPSSFYFVNPEPFLPNRVTFPPELAAAYASQGISRPDGMTLPNNCQIGNLAAIPMGSSGGGVSASELGTNPMGHLSDVGYAADMAMGELRDAIVDLTKIAADEFTRAQLYNSGRSRPNAAWATMVSTTAEESAR